MFFSYSLWPILSIVFAVTNVAAAFNDSAAASASAASAAASASSAAASARRLELFRILGGFRPPNHTLAKHYVAVVFQPTANLCGGSILSKNTILTAGHCVMNGMMPHRPDQMFIVAGGIYRLNEQITQQFHEIVTIRVHSGYKMRMKIIANDIAVLHLRTNIYEDGITAQRIAIATERTAPGTICTTLGQGRIMPYGSFASELTYVELEILSNSKCRKIFRPSKWRFLNFRTSLQIRRTTICTVDPTGDKVGRRGTCHGDSGGPLICGGLLVGITSAGEGPQCGDGVDIFTNVYRFRDWIENRANTAFGSNVILLLLMGVATWLWRL